MVGQHHGLNRHEFEQTLGDNGQRSLVCCSPWVSESDRTQGLNNSRRIASEFFKNEKKAENNGKLGKRKRERDFTRQMKRLTLNHMLIITSHSVFQDCFGYSIFFTFSYFQNELANSNNGSKIKTVQAGLDYLLGASLVAQTVKHLLTMHQTRVQSLGWEDRICQLFRSIESVQVQGVYGKPLCLPSVLL